jgi:DNA-binding IclR family transcriptional regulator
VIEDPDRVDVQNGSIQSIDRCGQILRCVARAGSVRAASIAADLGIQRSTAHRYLASMEDAGMLHREKAGGYVAGPLLAQLGVQSLRRSRVVEEAAPYMESLTSETRQTAVLSIWGGRSPVVIRVQEVDDLLVHVSVREGAAMSIDSSHGYLFAAHLGETSGMRRALAEVSAGQRRDVEANMKQARELGFAEHSMNIRGVRAIAAPVFHADGAIAAVLALVGTTDGLPSGVASPFAQALAAAARGISAQLGFDGSTDTAATNPAAEAV